MDLEIVRSWKIPSARKMEMEMEMELNYQRDLAGRGPRGRVRVRKMYGCMYKYLHVHQQIEDRCCRAGNRRQAQERAS
jgi:hypothetical protein